MTSNAPFFIVGAGRSGTTLLQLMLAGHSRLHIPPETWFVRGLVERLPADQPLDRAQVEVAVAQMTGHERWPDMQFPAVELRRRARALELPTLGNLISLVYEWQGQLAGKPRVGGKTPHYFRILPQLATLFPEALFIHLIRDGRDVAVSWIDAGWNRYHEPDFEWVAAMRARQAWTRSTLAGRIHETRYESLVSDPTATLRSICQFLGETFEPAMLDWQQRLPLVAPRDRHLHRRLSQPLSADSIAVWRTRLRPWELFAIESCIGSWLRSAGYEPHFAGRWRPLLRATATLLRSTSPLLRYAIPRLQRRALLPPRLYL